MRKLRKCFFAWHSEAQFATHDVFLIEALVSLRTLRAKVVRMVACDASIELGEMKRHLYHGFGSGGALFFSVTYSGAMENSPIDHFSSWVFNNVFEIRGQWHRDTCFVK